MKEWKRDAILWVLASPILAIMAIVRSVRAAHILRLAMQPEFPCRTCGNQIALVGMWRCACGFCYQGHLLRFCPICKTFPQVVRCYRCNATEKVRR